VVLAIIKLELSVRRGLNITGDLGNIDWRQFRADSMTESLKNAQDKPWKLANFHLSEEDLVVRGIPIQRLKCNCTDDRYKQMYDYFMAKRPYYARKKGSYGFGSQEPLQPVIQKRYLENLGLWKRLPGPYPLKTYLT